MAQKNNSLDVQAKHGTISWFNYLHIASGLISMPFIIAHKVLFSPRPPLAYAKKPLKRRIGDTIARSLYVAFSTTELQWAVGNGLRVYQQWSKQYKLVPTIDSLDSDPEAHLFWIGPKRTDKVILYIPGGAYHFPATEIMFKFWRYSQLEWTKQGLEIGIAVLSYSVLPDAKFPCQLRQATRAIEYLLATGCELSNIQLVGDSAGGNLTLQLLSHILHPIPSLDIPRINLPLNQRFPGVYLMSPMVGLSNPEQWGDSFSQKLPYDITAGLEEYGHSYLAHVPDSYIPYVEPILAPDDWFARINNVVDRILISAGSEERLSDQDVVFFEKKIKLHHKDAVLEVQGGGIHDDPMMDFFMSDVPLENTLTPMILEWIAKGFMS